MPMHRVFISYHHANVNHRPTPRTKAQDLIKQLNQASIGLVTCVTHAAWI